MEQAAGLPSHIKGINKRSSLKHYICKIGIKNKRAE